jgi:hypothetical protein
MANFPTFEEFLNLHGGFAGFIAGTAFPERAHEMLEDFGLTVPTDKEELYKALYPKFKEDYESWVKFHNEHNFPLTIYRMIRVAKGVPLNTDRIGIYWTLLSYFDGEVWKPQDEEGDEYDLVATVDSPDKIDWVATITANLDYVIGREEMEIRLKPGVQFQLIEPKKMTVTASDGSEFKKVPHPEHEAMPHAYPAEWDYPVNWGTEDGGLAAEGRNEGELATDITMVIHDLIEEMGMSAYDINDGNCQQFAQELRKRVPGSEMLEAGFLVWEDAPEPLHFFVRYKGRYYDAESPKGEESWRNLSIFRNHKNANVAKRLYHGSSAKFDKFKTRRTTVPSFDSEIGGLPRMGAYFTESLRGALRFADPDGYVYVVDLTLNKPLDLRNLKSVEDLEKLIPGVLSPADMHSLLAHSEADLGYGMYRELEVLDEGLDFIPQIKKLGYDGMIFPDSHEGDTYVAFKPSQVKIVKVMDNEKAHELFKKENPQFARVGASESATPETYLYHVTFKKNLLSITQHGLLPDSGQSAMSAGVADFTVTHLVAKQGVLWWEDYAREVAGHYESNPDKLEQWEPIVLRVLNQGLNLTDDILGSSDCDADCFRTKDIIPPTKIQIRVGDETSNRWKPLTSVKTSATPAPAPAPYFPEFVAESNVRQIEGVEWRGAYMDLAWFQDDITGSMMALPLEDAQLLANVQNHVINFRKEFERIKAQHPKKKAFLFKNGKWEPRPFFGLPVTAAPKSIWYHGSPTSNLASILEHGLLPDADKNWHADNDANEHHPSRVSYGGIYLAQNLLTAMGAPRPHVRGQSVLVIVCEIQPNTLHLDEDDIVFHLNLPLQHLTDIHSYSTRCFFAVTLPNENAEWKEVATGCEKEFIKKVMATFEFKFKNMHPELRKRVESLLPAVWKASLARVVAHQIYKNKSVPSLKQAYIDIFPNTEWDKVPQAEQVIPSIATAESAYRDVVDQLTRVLRRYARVDNTSPDHYHNETARISTPIGFKGANRILAVVEIQDGEAFRKGDYTQCPMVVHYGKIPDSFFAQWKKQMGSKPVIKAAKQTTILYLDDVRVPNQKGAVVVHNYEEFVQYLKTHPMPDLISFDHDLALEHYPTFEEDIERMRSGVIDYSQYKHKTGVDCAEYIVKNNLPLKQWAVHSANPVGGDNIREILRAYAPEGELEIRLPATNHEKQIYKGQVEQGYRKKASDTEQTSRAPIEAHRSGNIIWIDWFEVPKDQRGKGLGTKQYQEWEAALPKDIELVRLYAGNTDGSGSSSPFWDKLGFNFVYANEQGSLYDNYMWKGVNGHPTPPSIEDESPDDDGYDITDEPEKHKSSAANFPLRKFRFLYHVGTMNISDKREGSLEGSGLSVSLHPNEWRGIARIGGHTWKLTKPNNQFLNAHSMNGAQRQTIIEWGIANGYALRKQLYRVEWFDDEMNDTMAMDFEDETEARNEAEVEEEGKTVKVIPEGLVGTDKLKQRTHQNRLDPVTVFDLLVTVYAEDVLKIDGVWWNDNLSPETYSAPRGVIFPAMVKTWKATQEKFSAAKKFYHGSLKEFPIGFVLTPQKDGYIATNDSLEKLLESKRPETSLPRAESVFMVKDVDDIEAAGGYLDYVYEVEPIGNVEHNDVGFYSEAQSYAWGHSDKYEAEKMAQAYWSGNRCPHDFSVMEYRCRQAKIVGIVEINAPFAKESASAVADSAAFKAWFGNSKVVDENGKPLVVYHATTGDFEAFSFERPLSWKWNDFPDGKGTVGQGEGRNAAVIVEQNNSWKLFPDGGDFASLEVAKAHVEETRPKTQPITLRPAIFFAENPAYAEDFAYSYDPSGRDKDGGRMLPCYLRMENPLDFRLPDSRRWVREWIRKNIPETHLDPKHIYKMYRAGNWAFVEGLSYEFQNTHIDIVGDLKAAGFDGYINVEGGHLQTWGWTDEQSDAQAKKYYGRPGHDASFVYAVFNPNQIKSALGNSGAFSREDDRIVASFQSKFLMTARPTDKKIKLLVEQYKLTPEQIEQVIAADPTEKDNVAWIAKFFHKGDIRLPEDTEKIKSQLETFTKLKRSPQFQGQKDIQRYTPSTLYDTLEANREDVSNKEKLRTLFEQGREGARLVVNDGSYKVFEVTDAKTLCELSSGTNWCTTQDSYAEQYLEDGPNYICYYQNEPYAQLDPESGQFMDVKDESLLKEVRILRLKYVPHGLPWDFLSRLAEKSVTAADFLKQHSLPDNVDEEIFQTGNYGELLTYKMEGDDPLSPELERKLISAILGDKSELDSRDDYKVNRLAAYWRAFHAGQRLPEIEAILLNSSQLYTAVEYAKDNLNQRWAQLESLLLGRSENDTSPTHYRSSGNVIFVAITYAIRVIKGRWPELEQLILKAPANLLGDAITNPSGLIAYCRDSIKSRWPELEQLILKKLVLTTMPNITPANEYARHVIGGAWPELEAVILRFLAYLARSSAPRPRAWEDVMNEAVRYALLVRRARWPELEPYLFMRSIIDESGEVILFEYWNGCVKGRWPEFDAFLDDENQSISKRDLKDLYEHKLYDKEREGKF